MATEKIVKCLVRNKDDKDAPPTSRYVPLEIFNLWKFLMEERHSFDISGPVTSLWFEKGAASESSYAGIEYEPVNQVELFYFSDNDGMLHQEVRYFPSSDPAGYNRIKEAFAAHYRDGRSSNNGEPKMNENPGVWIKR